MSEKSLKSIFRKGNKSLFIAQYSDRFLLCSKQLERKVLSDQIIVFEHDAQVELEVDFKVSSLERWAGEQSRKCHVDWNVNLGANVAVGDLKILNFRCVLAVAFCATASLNANQLDFDAFYRNLRMMDSDEAVEWLG